MVPPSPTIPGVVTINVVAVNGAQSFSPNPATLANRCKRSCGTTWTTSLIASCSNDRSVDTGDSRQVASSLSSMAIAAAGGHYDPFDSSLLCGRLGTRNPNSPPPLVRRVLQLKVTPPT